MSVVWPLVCALLVNALCGHCLKSYTSGEALSSIHGLLHACNSQSWKRTPAMRHPTCRRFYHCMDSPLQHHRDPLECAPVCKPRTPASRRPKKSAEGPQACSECGRTFERRIFLCMQSTSAETDAWNVLNASHLTPRLRPCIDVMLK